MTAKFIEGFDISTIDKMIAQIVHPEYGVCDNYDDIIDTGFLGNTESGLAVHCIEQRGGGEGGGEQCHSILQFGEDIFLKISYGYYSHDGFDFDYATLGWVSRSEKTVYVYN